MIAVKTIQLQAVFPNTQ